MQFPGNYIYPMLSQGLAFEGVIFFETFQVIVTALKNVTMRKNASQFIYFFSRDYGSYSCV